MKLAIGADHAGFDLKAQIVPWLEASGHDVVDIGAHALDPADDFPDFAAAVASSVTGGQAERGVMICGSGVGGQHRHQQGCGHPVGVVSRHLHSAAGR